MKAVLGIPGTGWLSVAGFRGAVAVGTEKAFAALCGASARARVAEEASEPIGESAPAPGAPTPAISAMRL